MLVIGGAALGALLGGYNAKRRGGSLADMAQYATVYAIALAIVGMVATIVIHRSMI